MKHADIRYMLMQEGYVQERGVSGRRDRHGGQLG